MRSRIYSACSGNRVDHRLPEAKEKTDSNQGQHLSEDGVLEVSSGGSSVNMLAIEHLHIM